MVQLAVCEVSWWLECVHWDPWVETLPGGMNWGSQGALLVVADSLAQCTNAEAISSPGVLLRSLECSLRTSDYPGQMCGLRDPLALSKTQIS